MTGRVLTLGQENLDIAWVLLCAGLVLLMQGGFLCVESGLTRAKNSINVAIKNVVDFAFTTMIFWCLSFGLMFGESAFGWIGSNHFAPDFSNNAPGAAFFLFQLMFCGTAATIVSGAVAERMRFGSYLVTTAIIGALVYPLVGHWAWGGVFTGSAPGWLREAGFVDFAGSTVVHSVGGWVALAALLIIGPRRGRFDSPDGPRKVTGSNLTITMLGAILLWIGWLGFNGGSNFTFDARVALISINTILGLAAGSIGALIVGRFVYGYAEATLPLNGSLGGLVAITAGCHAVGQGEAILIGLVGGLLIVPSETLLEKLRIDDAVGAVPVHLACGIWGTIAVGIFGDAAILNSGLSRIDQVITQIQGALATGIYAFIVSYVLLYIIHRFVTPLRITPDDEHRGLNISEHRATTELIDLFNAMDHQKRTGDISSDVSVEPFTEVGQIAERYNLVLGRVRTTLDEKDDALRRLEKAHAEIQRDLEMARTIQRQLIPLRPPELEGAQLVSEYIALEQVGGDFIDYLTDEEGNIGVLIADASGHGVPAALLASMAKMAVDSLRDRMHHPEELLIGLNRALHGKTRDHFVTACYCVFDSSTRRIRYSVGGHPPPFLLRPGRPVRQLEGRGSLLGIVAEPKLGEWELEIEPGDRLLFLTDGILECRAPDGTNMDESRLIEILGKLSEHPAAELTSGFMKGLADFMGAGSFEDDVSFVALYAT